MGTFDTDLSKIPPSRLFDTDFGAAVSGAIAATCAASSGLTGTLVGAGALRSTLAASGGLSGTLRGAGRLASTCAASSALSGTLNGAGKLAATCTASGHLVATLQLFAKCSAVASLTGSLRGSGNLSAFCAASSSLTGTISGRSMFATCAASGSLSGTILGAGRLTAAAAATTSCSGTLMGAGRLSTSAIAASSSCSANLRGRGALSTSISATASCSANARGAGRLAAICAASGGLVATLATKGAIAATLAAISTCSGTLRGAGALAASIAARATCTGTIANLTPVGGMASYGGDAIGVPKHSRSMRPLFWREARRAAFRAALKRAGQLDGIPEVAPKADGLLERVVAKSAAQAPPQSVEPTAPPAVEAAPARLDVFDRMRFVQVPDRSAFAPTIVAAKQELPAAVAIFPLLPTEDAADPFELAELRIDYRAWQVRQRLDRLAPRWRLLPKPTPAPSGEHEKDEENHQRAEVSARAKPTFSMPETIERVVYVDRRVDVPVSFERHAARDVVHRDSKPAKVVVRADPTHPVMTNGKIVGYQWGTHGKVYKTRARAEEQAKAIYAAGWRGDARGRGILATALAANKAAEMHYTRDVVALFRGVHRGIMGMVDSEILPETERRADARPSVRKANDLLNARLNRRIAKHLRDKVGPLFDVMAKRVGAKNAQAMTMLGIPLRDATSGVAAQVAVARENNLRLIEDAGRSYADDVREVISDPQNEGVRSDELRDQLLQRGSVSVSRATLIAVDQTLKLSAAIAKSRQTAAGVASYKWSTSKDERVRPDHAALEGQVFDWDDPPVTNERTGDTNHPGEDYRCRCVPIPQIAGLDFDVDTESDVDTAAE